MIAPRSAAIALSLVLLLTSNASAGFARRYSGHDGPCPTPSPLPSSRAKPFTSPSPTSPPREASLTIKEAYLEFKDGLDAKLTVQYPRCSGNDIVFDAVTNDIMGDRVWISFEARNASHERIVLVGTISEPNGPLRARIISCDPLPLVGDCAKTTATVLTMTPLY